MTDTEAPPEAPATEPPAVPTDGREDDDGSPLTESILDNLPAWAFLALAVAALYLVWASLVIVDKYVGNIPAVGV